MVSSSHAIDLKDHLNYSLNNLRFTDKLWETEFFVNSGFYTNRLSISDITNIYKNIGFRITIMNKLTWMKYHFQDQNLLNNSKIDH